MSDLKEKLHCPVTYCTSSSETYKSLQDHMVRKYTNKALKLINMDICDYMFEILRLTLLNQRESFYYFLHLSIVLVLHFIMPCVQGFIL